MKTIFEFCSAAFFQGDCLIMTCRSFSLNSVLELLFQCYQALLLEYF